MPTPETIETDGADGAETGPGGRAWVYDPDDQPVLRIPAGGASVPSLLVKSLRDCAELRGRKPAPSRAG